MAHKNKNVVENSINKTFSFKVKVEKDILLIITE